MKKILFIFSIIFMFATNCYAKFQEEGYDGLWYWNGDPNYVFIESGSHISVVADLSSAYIDDWYDNKKVSLKVRVLNFFNAECQEEKIYRFIENQNGDIYYEVK